MNKQLMFLVACMALGYGAYDHWIHREYRPRDGILVRTDPYQTPLAADARAILHGKDKQVLVPVATYILKARVLEQERYFLDPGSSISPIDLCVGWGLMSSNSVLDQLSFSQSNRFCYYHAKKGLPILENSIHSQMANVHIIPANDIVRDQIFKLRPGQIIELKGELVNAHRRDGGEWNSSLTRTDTGNGACELMYVRSIYVENL